MCPSEPAAGTFPPVAAEPYPWPFDGRWGADDTALLLIGLQAGPIAALGAEPVLTRAARAAALAHGAGIAVIATRRAAPAPCPQRGVPATAPDASPERGSPGWALAPDLPTASVLDHAGDNAFLGTGLAGRLRAEGRRNLVLAGLATDGALHATARAAGDHGFECLTLSDASAGTTPARHAAQLRITTFGGGLFGAVAPLAELEAALTRNG